jgi:hypothetical protein
MAKQSENLKRSLVVRWRLLLAFLERLFHALAIPVFLSVAACLATIWLSKKQWGAAMLNIRIEGVLLWAGCFGLCIVAVQTWINYKKSKYDVTLALQYSKIWFDEKKPERLSAATSAMKLIASPKDQQAMI